MSMDEWKLRKAADSRDRVVSSTVTVERLLALREHYGITRVSDVTGLDDLGLPIHIAVRPRSISSTSIHSGKGPTASDSMTSALAEAIEVDCAERFTPADLERGTSVEVASRHHAFVPRFGIPGRFGIPPDLQLDWTFVENLTAEAAATTRGLLPIEFIRQGSVGNVPGVLFPENMSSGLASGNIREEAICHAIEELIERDALMQFLFRAKYRQEDVRRTYQRIALDSLPPSCAELVERFRRAGRRVTLLNLTTDVGVCTILSDVSGCGGFGAALDAERAVIRALTESAQTSTLNIQGAREDLGRGVRNPRVHDGSYRSSFRVRQVLLDPFLPELPFGHLASRRNQFVDQDLNDLLTLLRAAGVRDVFVCDVGDAQCVDFAVVRVVIPELESYRNDTLGPRRLRHALSS
jgi:ribosomal protein S12 methylthiotransferase accessory factor